MSPINLRLTRLQQSKSYGYYICRSSCGLGAAVDLEQPRAWSSRGLGAATGLEQLWTWSSCGLGAAANLEQLWTLGRPAGHPGYVETCFQIFTILLHSPFKFTATRLGLNLMA